MAISIVGSATHSTTNPTTSLNITIPAGTQAGDILVAAFVNRNATADPTVTDDDTGGNAWSKLHGRNADTRGAVTVYWKRATSGTASKVISASGFTNSCAGGVTVFRGASAASNPFSQTTIVSEANASGNETQAQINVIVANSMVFLVVGNTGNDTDNVNGVTATDPSSLAEQFEAVSSGGSDCSVALACAIKTTAGNTGSFNWSQSNDPTGSIAFALEPNVAPTVTPDTADATTFNTLEPTLEFHGDDADGDSLEAQIQIDTVDTFDSNTETITRNNTSTQTGQTDFTTHKATKSHTFNSNNHRLALISITLYNDSMVGVTVNSVAATLIDSIANGSYKTYMYQLVAPATGAQTVEIETTGGSVYYTLTITDFYGVDQNNPINDSNKASGNSNTLSVGLTTDVANTVLVDSIATQNNGTNTKDASQTELSNLSATFVYGGTSTKNQASAGSPTMQWTNSYFVALPWAIIAVAIAPYTAPLLDKISSSDSGFANEDSGGLN